MTQLYRIKASVTDEMLNRVYLPLDSRQKKFVKKEEGRYLCTLDGLPWNISDEWVESDEGKTPEARTKNDLLDAQKEAMRREIYIRMVCDPKVLASFKVIKDDANKAVQAYYEEE